MSKQLEIKEELPVLKDFNTISFFSEIESADTVSKKIEVLNKVLLYWDQTDWTWKQRLQLFESHYSKFLDCIEKTDLAFMFLESLQETHAFSFENYTELVSAFLHFTEKMRRNRSGSITEDEKQEWFVLKLHVHKDEIQKKISSGHMKELVRWLFSDV